MCTITVCLCGMLFGEKCFAIICFRPACFQRSSMGPSVGLPIQKRGRLGGRSGDLLSVRPSEKVHEFYTLDFILKC